MSPPTTTAGLKSLVRHAFEALCNQPRDLALFRSTLASRCNIQHASGVPITDPDIFMAGYERTLAFMPDLHLEIVDMIAELDEEGGGRVWICSRITGKEGKHQVESVDMVTVDKEGKIVASRDVQRALEATDE